MRLIYEVTHLRQLEWGLAGGRTQSRLMTAHIYVMHIHKVPAKISSQVCLLFLLMELKGTGMKNWHKTQNSVGTTKGKGRNNVWRRDEISNLQGGYKADWCRVWGGQAPGTRGGRRGASSGQWASITSGPRLSLGCARTECSSNFSMQANHWGILETGKF